jgi:hypothetical protein
MFGSAMIEVLALPATDCDELVDGSDHVMTDLAPLDGVKERAA